VTAGAPIGEPAGFVAAALSWAIIDSMRLLSIPPMFTLLLLFSCP
jgi:hypothetical protein